MDYRDFLAQSRTGYVTGKFDLSDCGEQLYDREFEKVSFVECELINGCFASCSFIDCVFTNTVFEMTELAGVSFDGCKMVGFRINNKFTSFSIS